MLHHKPYLIGIAGPSGAGKSFLADHLVRKLGNAVILPIDAYYPDLSHLSQGQRAQLNFDDPNILDTRLLFVHVAALSRGEKIEQPVYDFVRHTRTNQHVVISPKNYVLIEGLFTLHWPEVRERLHTSIYVELSDRQCLERRIERDVRDRGRTPESVQEQFRTSVIPMAERYIRPSAAMADVLVVGNSAIQEELAAVLSHISQRRQAGI